MFNYWLLSLQLKCGNCGEVSDKWQYITLLVCCKVWEIQPITGLHHLLVLLRDAFSCASEHMFIFAILKRNCSITFCKKINISIKHRKGNRHAVFIVIFHFIFNVLRFHYFSKKCHKMHLTFFSSKAVFKCIFCNFFWFNFCCKMCILFLNGIKKMAFEIISKYKTTTLHMK